MVLLSGRQPGGQNKKNQRRLFLHWSYELRLSINDNYVGLKHV